MLKFRTSSEGFLLVEILVSLVLLTSIITLLIFALDTTDISRRGNDEPRNIDKADNNYHKFLEEYKNQKTKNTFLNKKYINPNSQVPIGKRSCDISIDNFSTSFFEKNVSINRLVGVSTSTAINYIQSIGDNIFVGLDSSSTTEPDLVAINKIDLNQYQDAYLENYIDIESAMYTSNFGPGVLYGIVGGNLMFILPSGTTEHIRVYKLDSSAVPAPLWNLKLPVSSLVAKTFTFDAETGAIFIGFARNVGYELFKISISAEGILEKVETFETNATINYLYVSGPYLFILNTLDPEIVILDKNTLEPAGTYDAIGAVGNGKRMDELGSGLIFGRTIHGNELSFIFEDISTSTISSSTYSEEWGAPINASVDDALSFDGGFVNLSMQNSGQINLYKYNQDEFDLVDSYVLPYGRGSYLACDSGNIYVGSKFEPVIYSFNLNSK